jgi:hypothetical protein
MSSTREIFPSGAGVPEVVTAGTYGTPAHHSNVTTMKRFVFLGAFLFSASCGRSVQVGGSSGPEARMDRITSADELVAAMHAAYSGRWYRNLTFVQKTTYLRPDGTPSRVETWYEAGAMPGRLRIDLGEVARGNGVLFRNDSTYQMQGGKVTQKIAGRNLLAILGFDVYAQPVATTLAQLRAEKINLSILHRDSIDGRPMFVVGAGPRDTTTSQFWIDAERMLFVRLVQTDARRRTQDIRFENYVRHGDGWVAERVRFLGDGRPILLEEYSNVHTNVDLDPDLFVPEKWATARHWYTAPK